MERVEDLEGRLHREGTDHKDALAELKKEREGVETELKNAKERLEAAIKEN